jgi:hypothetical protein
VALAGLGDGAAMDGALTERAIGQPMGSPVGRSEAHHCSQIRRVSKGSAHPAAGCITQLFHQ